MDPITAGLLVAANVGVSVFTARQKGKLERSQINLEVEQALLQAEEQALESTKRYREFVAQNAALAAMGYGGATGFRATAAKAESALGQDLKSIGKQQRYTKISGLSATAASRSSQFASYIKSGVQGAMMAEDLGIFKKNPETKPDSTKGTKKLKGLGK